MDENQKTLGLVNFSVDKRVTITMFILIIMVFGFLSLSRLGLDMLPDITFPMVTVVTQYPGVAPEEMEQLVTVPLEGVIAGVNGVKKLWSQSSEGIATIYVEFEWGANLDYASQDIKDNIGFISDFLPEDAGDPVIFKFNLSQIPIMFVGVSGPYDSWRLKEMLEDNVLERLQRLDGVAQAAVYGEKFREIHIAVDPGKLQYKGLGIIDVVAALRSQNLNTPAGYFVKGNTDYLFRAIGQFSSIDDIGNAIVGISRDGTPVMARDIADIRDTFREIRNRTRMNGKESVFLILSKRSGSNTLRVSQRVEKELEKIKTLYPDLSFVEIFNQGRPVEKVTNATTMNAVAGGILAVLFMLVFLMNIRPTLIIAVAIPLSIITTFIALYMAGYTLNLMTLGGLALGVGMLVDNAIVVIENIYRHLEHGVPRPLAAKRGASEVAMAITASTLTTVVVFLPILFSEGMASQLFRGVALTIIFSLLASLFVALTIVPMLASVFFKERRTQETAKWFLPVRQWYVMRLTWVLRHPGISTGVVVVILLISAIVGVRFLGKEFMPQTDGDRFLLKVELPVGTTLEETSALCEQIRTVVMEYPEVEIVGEMVGRSEMERGGDQNSATGPHSAQIIIRMVESEKRKKNGLELQEEIRKRLPVLKDCKIAFSSMGSMGGDAKPVSINIYGKDLDALKDISETIQSVIEPVKGLRDIETSFSRGRPEYHFVIDKQKALTYGLAPIVIQQTLETANLGKIATQLRTGDDEIDIRVIMDKRFRTDLNELRNIPLRTPAGAIIPLSQVVAIERHEGPTIIKRDNKFRVATVDANLADRDLGSAVKEIRGRLARIEKALPDGYSIVFKGQFEDMQETFAQLTLGLLIAVLLVYMVMASQFESLVHPFIIMTTMPLSIIGVVFILLVFGKTFSVVAFIGIIILAGIVVNNGIVLIDYVNQLRRRGVPVMDALVEAGQTRIRPVLITAGTTVMGMLPMALSRSDGSEMRSPMALTVIGGLVTSTLLTLFVVPVVYLYIDRLGGWVKDRVKWVIH